MTRRPAATSTSVPGLGGIFRDLGDPIRVPFSRLFLDPNNPRIAPVDAPRYEDPDLLFDAGRQRGLEEALGKALNVDKLEDAILAQGWVPIDPILVWEHPARAGCFVVVEGNTRTVALRRLRGARLERERSKLERLTARSKSRPEEVREQRALVSHIELIASSTNEVSVHPVLAANVEDLEDKLPTLLGVRHITHAQQWTPYAANLYVLSLYDRLFRLRHGPEAPLRLETDIVKRVADIVSLGETKTRRNIQAASAFSAFKNEYEDRLPEGDTFEDQDQYFFELILQYRFAQEQFEFDRDALRLPKETAEVLFQWAFSKPRKGGKDRSENVFYEAENIRLWNTVKNFDDVNGTSFAARLDVDQPDKAQTMRDVEADYLQRKRLRTPINALASLIEELRTLETDTLVSQAGHLTPMLEEVGRLVEQRLRMLRSLED